MNRNIYFHPLHDSSDGAQSNGRDERIDRLVSQLDSLGAAHAREAADRGLADRVFSASVRDLSSGSLAQSPRATSGVLARIGWQRWAGIVASAAVVGLAVMVPLGVFNTPVKRSEVVLASQAELAPAGLSELIVVGLFDDNAVLESIDPSRYDGLAPVAMTRGHRGDQVQGEIQGLVALGVGSRGDR